MTTMHFPYPELAEGTYITPNPASSFDNEYNNLTKHDLLEKESVRLTYSALLANLAIFVQWVYWVYVFCQNTCPK